MKLPQFQIGDLFWSVTLIGVGIGCWTLLVYYVDHISEVGLIENLVMLLLMFGGPTLVAAGIAAQFRRKRLGAMLGFALFLLLWIVLVVAFEGHIPIY